MFPYIVRRSSVGLRFYHRFVIIDHWVLFLSRLLKKRAPRHNSTFKKRVNANVAYLLRYTKYKQRETRRTRQPHFFPGRGKNDNAMTMREFCYCSCRISNHFTSKSIAQYNLLTNSFSSSSMLVFHEITLQRTLTDSCLPFFSST
jgi:hypothetical protein